MRASNWLRRLLRSERGNALVIGAGAMPLLMASAAVAVDTIQLSVFKRQLQRAADSAAIAGAYALAQDETPSNAVHNDLDRNYFPTLTAAEQVDIGARLGFNQTVRVRLTSSRTMPFMSLFTGAPSAITADATAALIEGGTFCVLSLYDGDEPGIDVNGNATVDLGCGMASNSEGNPAVTAGGSSWIRARPIMSPGNLTGTGNNFVSPTTLQPFSAPQRDPFRGLPSPSPSPSSCTGTLSVGPGDTLPLDAGDHCYSSVDIKGTLTVAAGSTITVYGGNLSFGSQANVTAPNVTWVMTGADGAAGDLSMNGQATLNLSAPTDGVYDGILFYRDRRASNIEIKINGGSTSILEGAFYFPSSDVTFTGNAGLQTRCFQMVGQIIKFRGTADLTNTCPGEPNLPGFELTYVRLVA